MKTIITYITDDGKKFDDVFHAKRHQCELTEHTWDYYNKTMGQQKELNEQTHMKFCKNCNKQEFVDKVNV